ncbi:MAG: TolC family protein [Verrucomicrobia bacterium]|nr:TolC family protein [Verrucomicrobiota bacterium]
MKLTLNKLIGAIPLLCLAAGLSATAAQAGSATPPGWLAQPLSLADCLNLCLKQNSTITKAQADLEAGYALEVQTKAITLPRVNITGNYKKTDSDGIEHFAFIPIDGDQSWNAGIQVVQSIYEGGKIKSSKRAAKATREQAVMQYRTIVSDTLLAVRVAHDDALLAGEQIAVQEASVNLLKKELEDTTRRFEAGTVPRFNVLRAEVELANARPRLIRAKNAYRIAKNNLVNLLGYNLPPEIWEDIPLKLSGKLAAEPIKLDLPVALAKAAENRSELAALAAAEKLRTEDIVTAKAGRLPSVQLFTGYNGHNSMFSDDLSRAVGGWNVGGQLNWPIFDGWLTKGKVEQASALHRRVRADIEDTVRRIELEVRTAYSNLIEAREVLESQKKVQEQADEALRLANARASAGSGTQLDVLNAQTALTEARTTQILALHDYSVARAKFERAVGLDLTVQDAGK